MSRALTTGIIARYNHPPDGSLTVDPTSLAFNLSGTPSQSVTINSEGGSSVSVTANESWINWNVISGSLSSNFCVISVSCNNYTGWGRTGSITVFLNGPGLSKTIMVNQADEEDPEF